MKNKFYKDFKSEEILEGYHSMLDELLKSNIPENHILFEIFNQAWTDFVNGLWSYDGATFVNERNKLTIFEVAAFIHDWRNSMGYVGYYIDNEMFKIMILLNYNLIDILKRYILTRFTFFNKIRHIIRKTYKKEKPKLYLK